MILLGFSLIKRKHTSDYADTYNKNTRYDEKSDEQDKNRTYKNISYTAC